MLATPSGLAAFALVAITAFFVFGLGSLVESATALEDIATHGASVESAVGGFSRAALLLSLVINFVLFTVPVALWAIGAEGLRGRAVLGWMGLRREGLRRSAWEGAKALGIAYLFLAALTLALQAADHADLQNQRAEAIAGALDIPSAIVVAMLTGVGEEVFFRGLLLRKVGLVPQALLFGLAHLNYLQPVELVAVTLLGYLFGRVVQRTGNLGGAIMGHAVFNGLALVVSILQNSGAFPA
jgi:membrane protease YdiL (CAAX protease family)